MEAADILAAVLVLAVLIGCVNHIWIKLPPAIGMLIGSLVLSALVVVSDRLFHLHVMSWFRGTLDAASLPHIFLDGVLALLLFAGSLHVDVAELSRRRWMILLLATASVILSMTLFGAGIWAVFAVVGAAVPLAWCLVLGAILAPTDAVVIENLLRQVNLPPRLRAAIVGESLFNDGAGVVLFLVALRVTQGENVGLWHGQIMAALARDIAGGAAIGFFAGWLGVAHSPDLRRSLATHDLARAGDRLLPARDLGRLVGPDRRGDGGAVHVVAVAALRHDTGRARGADRLLVAARSASQYHAVSADGIADPRPGHTADRVAADRIRHSARDRRPRRQRRRADCADARKHSRQGAQRCGADLGRLARRHFHCAGADAARFAVAHGPPRGRLRGGDL
jgi:hypothetical protein